MKQLLTILLFVSTLAKGQAIIGIAQTQQCELRLNNFSGPNCSTLLISVLWDVLPSGSHDTTFLLQSNYNYTIPLPGCKPNSFAVIRSYGLCGINEIWFQLHVVMSVDTTVQVYSGQKSYAITTYPNPAYGSFFVRFAQNKKQDYEVKIYDVLGRLVKEVTLKNVDWLNYRIELSRGNYYVKVNNEHFIQIVK